MKNESKRKGILKNSVSGAWCEVEIDLDKTLINNIRVWCHMYGSEMRHFIPVDYCNEILKDNVDNKMNITADLCFGEHFVNIDKNKILAEQVKSLKDKHVKLEVRMNIDNYEWKKGEVDIYEEDDAGLEKSSKNQLVVSYETLSVPKDLEDAPETGLASDIDVDTPNEKKPKKSKKIVPILLGFIGVGAAAAIAAITIVTNPVNKIEKMLETESYEEAIGLYNEKISEDEDAETKIHENLKNLIEKWMKAYLDDHSVYEEVSKNLTMFMDIDNGELSERAKECLALIELNETANADFQEAEGLCEEEDYLAAMKIYMAISEEAQTYAKAQERYLECRGVLLEQVANPETAEDYEEYINLVNQYIENIEDEEFTKCRNKLLEAYALLVENSKRTEILTNAETAFEQGDYSGLFALLANGLEELPEDIILMEATAEYQKKYIDIIKAQAEEQVENKNYAQAMAIVNQALTVYYCEELQTLLTTIDTLNDEALEKYNVAPVDFLIYKGNIAGEDEQDPYEFTAPQTGRYGISVHDLVSGFRISISVYSVKSGEELTYHRNMENNNYFYVDLQANEAYRVVVTHYSQTGDYTVKVGQKKPTIDLANYNVVNDSMEHENQQNTYTFVPSYNGNYRFDFTNVRSGFKMSIYVNDSLGYEVGRTRNFSNNEGITVNLNAGETYTLTVCRESGVGDYSMNIGRQTATSTLSLGKVAEDTIDFRDQRNYYRFVPTETGSYMLNFKNMESGFNVSAYVFDSLGYEVARNRGLGNDGTVKFDMNAGQEYTIRIDWHNNTGSYQFALNRNWES